MTFVESEIVKLKSKVTLPNCNTSANVNITSPDTPKPEAEHIIDYIDANGYISQSDVDKLLGVSQATANRILKRMTADGLICKNGRGRKTKYIKK